MCHTCCNRGPTGDLWLSLLNDTLLAKEQSLPMLTSWVWHSQHYHGSNHYLLDAIYESATTRLPQTAPVRYTTNWAFSFWATSDQTCLITTLPPHTHTWKILSQDFYPTNSRGWATTWKCNRKRENEMEQTRIVLSLACQSGALPTDLSSSI
jgi:hypothetical protein